MMKDYGTCLYYKLTYEPKDSGELKIDLQHPFAPKIL